MARVRTGSSRSRLLPVQLPECGYSVVDKDALGRPRKLTCRKHGDHHCGPRVAHVVAFFREVLVHTKGRWARRPFVLADWQRKDIV